MDKLFAKITAAFTAIIAFFCAIFGIPYYAVGDRLDLSDLTQTFCEEFDGELDRNLWVGHYTYGSDSSLRRGGYWNNDLAEIRDGNLVIPVVYLENGMGGKPAGWYTAGIQTNPDNAGGGFSQKYGYFECRCILPEGEGIWAAFWMMNDDVSNVDGNGIDGTEIDIFESPYYGRKINNRVSSDLHYDGYDEAHRNFGAKEYLIKGNPYKEYNTYGLLWNEEGYTFYINGVESFTTDFGGVSANPEYMILSVEVSGYDGVCNYDNVINGDRAEFIVDYVKVYQYNDLL